MTPDQTTTPPLEMTFLVTGLQLGITIMTPDQAQALLDQWGDQLPWEGGKTYLQCNNDSVASIIPGATLTIIGHDKSNFSEHAASILAIISQLPK